MVKEVFDAQVIAVLQLEAYRVCLQCKARVEPQVLPFDRCSRSGCEMMQRFEECIEQVTAKVMFRKASGALLSLHAIGNVKQLAHIPNNATVNEADLMMAPP